MESPAFGAEGGKTVSASDDGTVLSRSGRAGLGPQDLGWKDTVLTWPGETVRIILRFEQYPGLYVLHCHNLEHEDAGMMSAFEVA